MPLCALALLSGALAWAVYQQGGVLLRDWNVCLLEISLLALAWRFLQGPHSRSTDILRRSPEITRRSPDITRAPRMDRLSQALLTLFGFLALLQIVPLPLPILQILSPARASLVAATAPVLGPVSAAPLSATPARTLEHLERLAAYLLVFLLIRDLAWHWRRFPWIPVLPLLAIAAAESVLGLYQSFAQGVVGATGTYVNHNHFAGFLELCLPFAVVYPASRLPASRTRALGAAVVAVLIAAAILQSLSRMGVTASFLALLTVGCLTVIGQRRLAKRTLAALLLAAFVLVAWAALPGGLLARFNRPVFDADLAWRTGVWRDTTHLIAAYPLFGCGLGSYESCFSRYQTVTPTFTIDFAHNDYLQLSAELGLIAFAAGLFFLLLLFLRSARAALTADPPRRLIALACAGAFVAILVHSAADFNLYLPANAMLLAWISGIAAAPAT